MTAIFFLVGIAQHTALVVVYTQNVVYGTPAQDGGKEEKQTYQHERNGVQNAA